MKHCIQTIIFFGLYILGNSYAYSQIGFTRPQLDNLYGKSVGHNESGSLYTHNGYVINGEFNSSGLCSTLIIQKTQDGTWNSRTVIISPELVRNLLPELSGNEKWQMADSSSGGVASVMASQAKTNSRINFVFVTDDYNLCSYMMDERIITIVPNHDGDISRCKKPTQVRDINSMTIADVLSLPYSVSSDLLQRKLDSIIIPQLYLVDVPVNEAFEYLTQVSIKNDNTTSATSSLGVRFKIPPAQFNGKTITLNLKDVPLIDAIKYFSASINAFSKIESDGCISILPVNR
jgi:hypothetical protein